MENEDNTEYHLAITGMEVAVLCSVVAALKEKELVPSEYLTILEYTADNAAGLILGVDETTTWH